MANTKTYTVVKNGEALKELKTLAAAKKLADSEGGEVICEGVAVYPEPVTETEPANETEATPEEQVEERLEPTPEKYTLTAKMNIRTAPSLKADKVGIAEAGTVVEQDLSGAAKDGGLGAVQDHGELLGGCVRQYHSSWLFAGNSSSPESHGNLHRQYALCADEGWIQAADRF
ncbi:MAG: hypothetical protein J1E60_00635 [Christensenellaceae bacterium]|nr:hypothetical protein [Christensenellaceae bacterium]